ncbi:MAG: substrate-binding domain-containing protein [Propionibacteriales bacterium]|nr:substrate-binding domain-containing protein [Propionibacteriales bacterium]
MKSLPTVRLATAIALPVLAAAGCSNSAGSETSKAEDVKVYYLAKRLDQGYFQSEVKGVEAKAKELGIDVEVLDSRSDGNVMTSNLETALIQGGDGVIIVVPDQKLAPAVLAKTREADVPVLALDDPMIDSNGDAAPFLGYEFEKIGTEVGDFLAELAADQGWAADGTLKAAALTFNEVSSCTERTDATKAALLDNVDGLTEQDILETNYAGANTDGGLQAMQGLLTANPEVEHWLVYSCNEEGVVGAVRALESAGVADGSCGVGIGDGALAKIEMLKDEANAYCGNVFIDGEENGGIAVQLMYDALTGEQDLPASTLSPGVRVTRDNAAKVFS